MQTWRDGRKNKRAVKGWLMFKLTIYEQDDFLIHWIYFGAILWSP